MRRTPSPGTFTVKGKGDGFVLAGVRQDGTKLRMKVATLTEGHTLGRSLFQGLVRPVGEVTLPKIDDAAPVDEFGVPIGYKLPQVSAETIGAGVPKPAVPGVGAAPAIVASPRNANAKSLSELLGVAGASLPVYLANQFLEPRYEVVPKPSKKHMNDLADEIKAGIQQTFGDREVGHWTMAILLAIGIPVAMWLQASGPKKLPEKEGPNLQSVP